MVARVANTPYGKSPLAPAKPHLAAETLAARLSQENVWRATRWPSLRRGIACAPDICLPLGGFLSRWAGSGHVPHRPGPALYSARQEAEQRVPANPLKEPAAAESTSLREGLSCITGKTLRFSLALRGWAFALLPHASHNTLCSRNRVIRGPSRKRDPPLRDFRTKWRYARAGLERLVIQNANDPGPRILAANPPRHAARQPL